MESYFWFWAWSVILGVAPGFIVGLSYCYCRPPDKVDVISDCFAYAFGPWIGTLVLIFVYDPMLGWRTPVSFIVSIVSLIITDYIISIIKMRKNMERNRIHWAEKNARDAAWAANRNTT